MYYTDLYQPSAQARPSRAGNCRTATSTSLFGLRLVNARREAVADALITAAAEKARLVVSFVNAHCINIARRDAAYADTLHRSDVLLPDGSGVRFAAALAGAALGDNLNGTDLFPAMCLAAAQRGVSIFLLGGLPGVAAAAAETMVAACPGLRVGGTADGFFGPDATAATIARINASGAAIVFVGMGVPMQENWIAEHQAAIAAPVILGVGGLFDYYSGRIARAPQSLRAIGCEWMWRLAKEPRRMARRYLVGNISFVAHAFGYAFHARHIEARSSAAIKRTIDVVAASAMAIAAAPLLAAAALAIKFEDGGPIFFRQTRIGEGGRPFTMLKFRSMVVDAERRRAALLARSDRDAVCFKMRRDPRITRIGALLRRCSLDELPQIFNVLSGSMSLVGPRPALPQEVVTYTDRSRQRLEGKPGITCTWQVSGRAEIPFEQQVSMDIDYLANRRLWTDLSLLFRTLPAVIGGRGAY